MKEMMMNDEFSDVTLVTGDRKQVKLPKNILSACSPFFREMLQIEKGSNSIIFLRGINYSEIESILQFIYLGKAIFPEERLNEVLNVARSLKIKVLSNEGMVGNNVADIKNDEILPSNLATSPVKDEISSTDSHQVIIETPNINHNQTRVDRDKPWNFEFGLWFMDLGLVL